MDFFESQDRARRKTTALVGYYIAAVLAIMFSIYLVFVLLFAYAETPDQPESSSAGETTFDPRQLWEPELFLLVMAGTLLVVGGGTIYKVASLSGGGESVAKLFGGRKISSNTDDPDERKILNVVEEMAIASGIPVPPVFLLENENGINAFAAGFNTDNAVISVTKGAVQTLSRDELQGVIAHEFSHILNGDMRLNIKLIGVLHGLLLISLIGYFIMRSTMFSSGGRSSKKGKGGGQIVILGFALMIIGYIGVFFGKLIKSAVSRQREFLADASAVQFTRNPEGIAGALKKIGGFKNGSRLQSLHAEEASHLFFSNGLRSSFLSLMSTHPPLEERIKRLDSSFAGELSELPAAATGSAAAMGFAQSGALKTEPEKIVSSIGAPDAESLGYAVAMLAAIPHTLDKAARDPVQAQAVVYNLLLSSDDETRATQMKMLETSAAPEVHDLTMELASAFDGLKDELRLPLSDIAVASLAELSREQYNEFKNNIEKLIVADQLVDIFEYTLNRMIIRHLSPRFEKPVSTPVRYYSLKGLEPEYAAVLSCIAYWGTESDLEAEEVFGHGMAKLGGKASIKNKDECTLSLLDQSLVKLAAASPAIKKRMMDACVSCVTANNAVTATEFQVLRAIGDYLGCPVPPVHV